MHTEPNLKALQFIYQVHHATRSDVMSTTGLSHAGVVRLVTELRRQGYLVEKPVLVSAGRGRPSDVFGINPEYGYAAGIEFGHDHLVIGFLGADGSPLVWRNVDASPPFRPGDATVEQLKACVRIAASQANIAVEKIRALGVAVHGVVSNNADWVTWEHAYETFYPVADKLGQQFNCAVHVEDVSRAFAEAEHRYGAGQGVGDMLYLFIGRHGVGAGIFVNNVLLTSTLGICGEVGHITVERDGTLCQCGNRGCLETTSTHEAVVSRVRSRLLEGVVSSLSPDNLTFAQVCQAYRDGDKVAHIVLNQLTEDVASALSSTINIVGATRVLIGGHLRLAGPDFLTGLSNTLRRQILPSLAQRLHIGYAELPYYAGAWGVASQALDAAWQSGSFLATSIAG